MRWRDGGGSEDSRLGVRDKRCVTWTRVTARVGRRITPRAARLALVNWSTNPYYVGASAVLNAHHVHQRSCCLDEETSIHRHRGRKSCCRPRNRANVFGECVSLRAQPYRSVWSSSPARKNSWNAALIGYSRIILAALALHYMSYHPKYCTVLYCISCLLDAFDGHAARALGQSSKFGAVLDMVTDR